MTSQDVTERDPEREFWGTPTLDTPEQNTLRWSDVVQGTPSAVAIQEVVLSGRELDLGAASDNSSRIWIAIDRPAQWKLLLPGGKITSPERFDRVFVMRDPANASDATKNYALRVGPRPGSLDSPTTPTPTVTVTGSGTGANAQQTQGTTADGAAQLGNSNVVAGKDNAGNVETMFVAPAGAATGATPKTLMVGGQDPTNNVVRPLPVVALASLAGSAALMVGGQDGGGTPNARMLTLDTGNNLNVRLTGQLPYGSVLTGYNPTTLAGKDAVGDTGTVRGIQTQLVPTAPAATDYTALVKNVPAMVGAHGNAWNATAVGIGGTSAALDTLGCSRVHAFGNTSGASDMTVQFSEDNTNWYDATALTGIGGNKVTGANGNFDISFSAGARYVRLKSTAAVTITATLAAKG